jgi:translation initiation factor IF-2
MKNKTTIKVAKTVADKTAKQLRPPVVVILGHIDHGKTTLLSKIKDLDLTRKEHGGITQHLGAYQVNLQNLDTQLKTITFIDTPGHAAFNNLRARGAKVADIAVLVVAASEGVKPQTLESLRFIKEANIPFIVALNKIDLPEADLEKAKRNLVENGILIEGFGGDVVVVPVSAKEGKGVKELMEMILLLTEMNGLSGSAQEPLEAVVIESKIDSHRGPLATILVRNGSLKQGQEIQAENAAGKIRAMFSDKGENVLEALPSQPVEVLGFKQVPAVGTQVKIIQSGGEQEVFKKEEAMIVSEKDGEKKLKIILKVDVEGTLEAIKANLPDGLLVIKAEVGEVNDSDVLMAVTNQAEIIAFNVKVSNPIKKLAETEKVRISSYQVIYELLENLAKKIRRFLFPNFDEQILGKAEIIAEFKMKDRIAGCRMTEGEIKKTDFFHLYRGEEIITNGRLRSLKQGKNDVEKVGKGDEFGAVFSGNLDFQIGDVLVSFLKPQSS